MYGPRRSFPCGPAGHFPHPGSQCEYHGPGLRIEGFIVPCLLLLLKEQPAHGYELMEKLGNLAFLEAIPDPGVVYRHLRRLEEDGMVASQLEPGGGGPVRKVYSLTPEGESFLRAWATSIRKRKASLEGFLTAFEKYFPGEKGGE
ncbi:MAG: PadR family transcriptional regulator [Clostridia bacterium]|nr:MAG: PadR family transcriptional regulator [Clostridia bacterium]